MASTVKTVLAIAATIFAAVVGIYIFIASLVYSAISDAASDLLSLFGLPIGAFQPLVVLVGLLATAPATKYIGKLAIGKIPILPTFSIAAISVLLLGGWILISKDWLFGARGEPLAFVCPPIFEGAKVRIQRQKIDHQLGGQCEPISRAIASQVLAIESASRAEPITLTSSAELRVLSRFDENGPLLLAGVPKEKGAPPQLYKGRIGIDPLNGQLLKPVTDQDLQEVQNFLMARERDELLAKQIQDALSRKEEDERRKAVERARAEAERTQLVENAAWKSYFVSDLDKTPLVIMLGNPAYLLKNSILASLEINSYWDRDVLKGTEFIAQVAAPMLSSPYRALSREVFPPGLRYFIVVKPNYQMEDGNWCVSVMRLDLQKWTAEKFSQIVEI